MTPPAAPQSDWARLFRVATSLIDQANAKQKVIDTWSFGGGTAMMLQIGHRESHDVDIFLNDPQLLGFLDPRTQDFDLVEIPSGYVGDGTRFLKLAYEGVGEIDFIVSGSLTDDPTTSKEIEGVQTDLETIAEIITKKVYYRAESLKPRDIFDIAAAAVEHQDAVISALKGYGQSVTRALATLERLNPDFVAGVISQLQIKEQYLEIAEVALARAQEVLHSARAPDNTTA